MKDAKGHGSNPRGSHTTGVSNVGLPVKMRSVASIHPTKDVFKDDPLHPGQTQAVINGIREGIRSGNTPPPLVVTPHGNLLDGHHRLAAYKAEKVRSVPVQVQTGYNENEIERIQKEKGLR